MEAQRLFCSGGSIDANAPHSSSVCKPQQAQAVCEPKVEEPCVKNNYPPIVQAIHNEFDTAGENLLAQAREWIHNKGIEDQIFKAGRLNELGFKNALQVKEGLQKKQMVDMNIQLVNTIHEYSVRYPNNKFITKEMAEKICKKYKLVCAPVGCYTGFVPERNLKDMERFVLQSRDEFKKLSFSNIVFSYRFGEERRIEIFKKHLKENGGELDYKPHYKGTFWSDWDNVQGFISSKFNFHLDKETKFTIKSNAKDYQICAPKKHMNTKGLKKKGFFYNLLPSMPTFSYAPDPVVLQPVKDGYLIVTAWGDEASDELVVNQAHN